MSVYASKSLETSKADDLAVVLQVSSLKAKSSMQQMAFSKKTSISSCYYDFNYCLCNNYKLHNPWRNPTIRSLSGTPPGKGCGWQLRNKDFKEERPKCFGTHDTSEAEVPQHIV